MSVGAIKENNPTLITKNLFEIHLDVEFYRPVIWNKFIWSQLMYIWVKGIIL